MERVVETLARKDDLNFQVLTENSVDLLCRVGLDYTMHYVSPACFRILGWTQEEMIGVGPEAFILAEDLHLMEAAAGRVLSPGLENSPSTVRMRKRDGGFLWMEMNARLVRDPETGEPSEMVVVMRDITERKLLLEELSNLAFFDGLTGLANRRGFDQALQRQWERTRRDNAAISLLLLDIDHFKRLNDQYGHPTGDDCLRAVAAAVRGAIRSIDIAARYGGEEIAVILYPMEAPGACSTAERLRATIEALHLPHRESPQEGGWLTASIGVATAAVHPGGIVGMPASLLLAADNALYKAKHEGRNLVVCELLVAP
jgi:diguanylate cyclase (GGDEF)-like protein/PAS domain S-box-containing protein